MMTREEQIAMLEESFNTLVQKVSNNISDPQEYDYGKCQTRAAQLKAVTEALIYLRALPNPHGQVDVLSPRNGRRLQL